MDSSVTLLQQNNWKLLLIRGFIGYFTYILFLALYRLFIHPLRNVPGPKLAALTRWVETYFECFKAPGGQFFLKCREWHKIYGPIIRISPGEVHIQDSSYYDTLYAGNRITYKLEALAHRFNNENSVFSTVDHDLHRVRRSALNQYFSRQKIGRHGTFINSHLERLFRRIDTEYKWKGNVLSLTHMWGAFSSDIIVGYTLEQGYDFISYPEFYSPFPEAVSSLLEPQHFITQFALVVKPLLKIPERILAKVNPQMKPILEFNVEMGRQVKHAQALHVEGRNRGEDDKVQSVFMALLDSDLPASELHSERLKHEAIAVVGAGFDTTTYAIVVASFHLLSDPVMLQKLRNEVRGAFPGGGFPPLEKLYRLPFLTAVINESLRLSIGICSRMPRRFKQDLVYPDKSTGRDYVLKAGTIISMDNYSMHMDPNIWPEPLAFRPERWADPAQAPDGTPLSRYLVAFGRGTRSCLGLHLAHAILYASLANFYTKFDCTLHETTRESIDVVMDRFVPRPKPGTLGVRVKVL